MCELWHGSDAVILMFTLGSGGNGAFREVSLMRRSASGKATVAGRGAFVRRSGKRPRGVAVALDASGTTPFARSSLPRESKVGV